MNKCTMIFGELILAGLLVVLTFSSAFGQISNVQVSNLTSSSATITWTTSDTTDGCVHYDRTTTLGDTTCDARPNDDVHYVAITGLSANTTYYFEVASGGIVDNNGGAYYAFTSAQMGSEVPYVIFGYVRLSDGTSPAMGTIVVVKVKSSGDFSSPLSTLTNSSGIWSLNLGNLKNPADGSVFSYHTGDTIFIDAQGAADGAGQTTNTVSGSSPQNTGTVVLSPIVIRGDANGDGVINPADVAYMINYLFIAGPAPKPLEAGDVNCDGFINGADVAHLINYFFIYGPPPGC